MAVRRPILLVGLILLLGGLLALVPVMAQETQPILTTNTPPGGAPLGLPALATNTPQPGYIPPVLLRPTTTIDRYALRLWTESEMVDVLLGQIKQLTPGDTERQLAIQLLQNELQRRFPGAPHDVSQRQQLIAGMLSAPRGSVDMRLTVRAFIAAALNETQPSFGGIASLDVGGFNVTIMPANVDGSTATLDAVLHTRYPATGDARYDDYTVAQFDGQQTYQILDSLPLLPAAPFRDIIGLTLERLGDVNNDGADELSLTIDTGEINRELLIFGWRGGDMVSLVQPDEHLLFGKIVDWPLQSNTLTTRVYQVESAAWGCLGERDIAWKWSLNYFRQPDQLDGYTFQNRLACLLYGSEPLFEKPTTEAISTIESILQFAQPEDQVSAQRASMIVAMLYLLDGRPEIATQEVQTLQSTAEAGSWLAVQTTTFMDASTQPGATPVTICAALENASTYGACDVDQVLSRLFIEQPLRRDQPLEAQLAAMGINVLDKQTVSAVGKRDRQAFRLDVGRNRWWAFAPLQADVYTAEKIDPLPGYDAPPTLAPLLVAAPDSAYAALLQENNPAAALNILDNTVRDSASTPLAPSARFLQSLCYDLLADRTSARRTYFALWSDDPTSVWGQLAATHLEQR